MSREAVIARYPEIYEYLDWLRNISGMSIYGIRIHSDEDRIKRHRKLMEKYGYKVGRNKVLYEKSKVLLDNLDVMIGWMPGDKVSFDTCAKLEAWLESDEFKSYMDGRSEGIFCRGRMFR